ncbi:MAG: hypothetical protein AAFS03_02385 [Pseudomonadota bacterium]
MPGRKPADVIARSPKPQGRAAIWAAIRLQGNFTRRSIRDATDCTPKTVSGYLDALEAGEFLTSSLKEDGVRHFTLIRDVGIEPPRVRKDGTEVTQGRGTANMWRSMRMMSDFTTRDLSLSASTGGVEVKLDTAKDYCNHLMRAGYLRIVDQPTPTSPPRYRLIRNTGPKPPQIQRVKQVFDPNLNQVVAAETFEALK